MSGLTRRRVLATAAGGAVGLSIAGGAVGASTASDEPTPTWRYEVPEGSMATTVLDDRAVVGTDDGTAFAVDVASGTKAWTSDLGSAAVAAASDAATGTVLLGGESGDLRAFDAQSGDARWRRALDGAVSGSIGEDGAFFVTSTSGTLAVVDATSGEVRWQQSARSFDRIGPVVPAVTDDLVLLQNNGGLLAYGRDAGAKRWSASMSTRWTQNVVAVADGSAYVTGHEGQVASVDVRTGEIEWERSVGTRLSGAVADGEHVYFCDFQDGGVFALQAGDGSTAWTGSGEAGTPTLRDGTLYVAGEENETQVVRAYAAETGVVEFALDLGDATSRTWMTRPAVDGDVLALGERNHVGAAFLGYDLSANEREGTTTATTAAGDDEQSDGADGTRSSSVDSSTSTSGSTDDQGTSTSMDGERDATRTSSADDGPTRGFFSNGEDAKSLEESVSTTTLSLLIGLVGTLGTIAQLRGGDD
ncbi:PQQ-binding-like beta-propeller repeat protein [Halorubellus litoreus]|uniref:PQQ-binding-like beta-propeller repeat protein n=1 Tax=Halorubellus litoreus TaxID=755308 RepID=A0ABD5VAJ9_9EURY